jgi:hypothetical protein
MRSKITLAGVAAVVAAALALAACGGEDPTPAASAQPAPPAHGEPGHNHATDHDQTTPDYTASPDEVEKLREEQEAKPEDDFFITAKMIVDVTFYEPGSQEKFCELHEALGDDMGWDAWRDG